MYYEKEEVGFVPYTLGPNQGHRDIFFITYRKFPEAISSAGSQLGLLIPFNTTTHSLCRWMAAVLLFKRTACFALSGFM